MSKQIIVDGITNLHFIEKFRQNVSAHPDKTALKGMGEEFSYRDLDIITDMVAEQLLQQGVKPGDLVVVLHKRHVNVFLGIIGCWKARCGYVFIDANAPECNQKKIIVDSGCTFVINKDFIEAAKRKVRVEGYIPKALPSGELEDPAWILYTSGSTGNPKGVYLNQSNIAIHMHIAASFGLKETDVQSMLASFSFMSGLMEGFPILYLGGTLSMIPDDSRRDINKIVRFWEEENINVGFVPSHYTEQIINAGLRLPPSFRTILTGGEPLHYVHDTDINVLCCYGSSECGGPVAVKNSNYLSKNYPIGDAIPMIKIYLVKEDSQELITEPDQIGEICVSGQQLSKGYFNNPELTSTKFFDNPFSDEGDYSVLYRTGDLGQMDEKGDIYYYGRGDLMCKIKSFRIELGAVEAAMIKYPGIKRCVAKPFRSPEGKKELHGFYYAPDAIDEDALREFMRNELLHYMVPAHFHALESVPVTDNGKVDRGKIRLEGYTE